MPEMSSSMAQEKPSQRKGGNGGSRSRGGHHLGRLPVVRARTSVARERARASQEAGPGCGKKCGACVESSRRSGSSLKTYTGGGGDGCPLCGVPCGDSDMPACRFDCAPLTLDFCTKGRGRLSLPTMTASCATGGNAYKKPPKRQGGFLLKEITRLLPTLTVCGNWNRAGASKNSGDGLVTALHRLGYRGSLNPVWAEVFMGFSPQWTDVGVWAMP